MNAPIETNAALAVSVKVYRALLILYPAEYRRDYGELMAQVFRDMCRDAYRARGLTGMLLWWCTTLFDLIFTAIEERRKVKFMFSKATLVQMAGFLLMAGGFMSGIAAFSQFQPGDHYSYHGIYQVLIWLYAPGSLLIGLGGIGLALQYEPALGSFGKWMLILSGISSAAMAVGVTATFINDDLWEAWLTSGIVHTIALTLFGLVHLRTPALPIFRGLPLMTASGWLIMMLGVLRTDSQIANNALSFLIFFGIGLGWLAIGQATNRQQRGQAAVATAQ